mmetsp:Transcript_74396/g.206089  ORF Transcript_74396/g.206089 Transcript_74396/m.206089 type:complete len:237 (+) Transcript_74396:144-854(+)
MPKSKRAKLVSLTKTAARPQERKGGLIERVREAVDEFTSVYVFSFDNMRTTHFKEVRTEWADSRFFLGKNKVMRVALGRSEEDEYRDGLAELGEYLTGNVGLLFTNRPQKEVTAYFASFRETDFARAGLEATETLELPAGAMAAQHTMLETFKKLGLPVRLDKGVVTLTRAHTVCTEGETLTVDQARLLKLLNRPISDFTITPVAMWKDDKVTELEAPARGPAGGAGGAGSDSDDA